MLPRLRGSTKNAASYLEACLSDNADSPESIALAFQDVADAYNIPISVSVKADSQHQRLWLAVVEKAKAWTAMVTLHGFDLGPEEAELHAITSALIKFEAEHGIGEK